MQGKLIIIEAGDGCGKETQANLLFGRLDGEGCNVRKVRFPDYDSPSSALIKMYLGGQFGSQPDAVNPYAASAFYAVDRFASYKREWEEFYRSGGIVIADRYTTSNMAHQTAKITDSSEQHRFLDWLWDFEFVKFGLPVPDGVFFLDMPPSYSQKLINRRAQQGRTKDIHECDINYLGKCYQSYSDLVEKYHWCRIRCVKDGMLRTIEDIHEEIYQKVKEML